MASADLPGIFFIVVEVLMREDAVLVANQLVGAHGAGIELHLDLHVLGDGHERRASFGNQHSPGLVQRVQVRVVAVAAVGQLLHRRILEIAGANAEHREEDALLALLFNQAYQLALARHPDVEVSVCGKDDAVDAALDE